jgi:hypothetical protein
MTCRFCYNPQPTPLDSAITAKAGWKRLSKEFKVSIAELMTHRAHIAVASVKKAIQSAGKNERRKIRMGKASDISLDTIARRLSKLATAAEASGNSDTAVRALTSLQSTLAQIREAAPKSDVTITVVHEDAPITNPVPTLTHYLEALLNTNPSDDVAHAAGRLLALLQGKGDAFNAEFGESNPTVVQ